MGLESRVELILQNILGASNEVDPESRVEKLLQNLIEAAYIVDPMSRVELLLENLQGGSNDVVPMSRVEMLIANALGESYDVVPMSRVEELLVLLAEEYAAVYKTVTGSVVTIDDAIPNKPIKSLLVDIPPVQDLHGYDSPWVAGGGVNLNPTESAGESVNAANRWYVAYRLPLSAGTYYTYTELLDDSSYTSGLYLSIDGGSYTRLGANGGLPMKRSFTLENDAVITLYLSSSTIPSDVLARTAISKTDIDRWTPYENICPISGWTGVQIQQTGKNLLTYTPNKITAPLNVTLDKSRATLVKKGITYTMSFDMQNATTWRICAVLFDLNGNRYFVTEEYSLGTVNPYLGPNVSGQYYVWGGNYTDKSFVITPIDDFYVMFFFLLGDTTESTVMVNPTLEIGSTPTPYELYQGQTIPISWQSEAGTVYGGQLNVLSGKLTVYPYYASYNGETLTGRWISDRDVYAVGTTPTIGAQVVNIGAEGTEIQLEPHEVKSLLGANNIFADTGDVTVEYLALKDGGD